VLWGLARAANTEKGKRAYTREESSLRLANKTFTAKTGGLAVKGATEKDGQIGKGEGLEFQGGRRGKEQNFSEKKK